MSTVEFSFSLIRMKKWIARFAFLRSLMARMALETNRQSLFLREVMKELLPSAITAPGAYVTLLESGAPATRALPSTKGVYISLPLQVKLKSSRSII
jgi:hypothetical protein